MAPQARKIALFGQWTSKNFLTPYNFTMTTVTFREIRRVCDAWCPIKWNGTVGKGRLNKTHALRGWNWYRSGDIKSTHMNEMWRPTQLHTVDADKIAIEPFLWWIGVSFEDWQVQILCQSMRRTQYTSWVQILPAWWSEVTVGWSHRVCVVDDSEVCGDSGDCRSGKVTLLVWWLHSGQVTLSISNSFPSNYTRNIQVRVWC